MKSETPTPKAGGIIAAAISEHLHYASVHFDGHSYFRDHQGPYTLLVVDPDNKDRSTMCIWIRGGYLSRTRPPCFKILLADPECIPKVVEMIDNFYNLPKQVQRCLAQIDPATRALKR